MNYTPETKFRITNDSRMVYNLRQEGWKKGMPTMVNDIAVGIEARHLPEEVQAEIARAICAALNHELENGPLGGLANVKVQTAEPTTNNKP